MVSTSRRTTLNLDLIPLCLFLESASTVVRLVGHTVLWCVHQGCREIKAISHTLTRHCWSIRTKLWLYREHQSSVHACKAGRTGDAARAWFVALDARLLYMLYGCVTMTRTHVQVCRGLPTFSQERSANVSDSTFSTPNPLEDDDASARSSKPTTRPRHIKAKTSYRPRLQSQPPPR